MRKEKETSRLALTLSCLKHLISISLCREWKLDLILINMIHFSNLLELLWSIFKNSHFFINGQHCLVSRCILIHGTIDLYWFLSFVFLVILDKSIFNEVIVFCFVPLFRVLDFDTVETADTHQLVAFFFLSVHEFLCLDWVIHILRILVLHPNVRELLNSF